MIYISDNSAQFYFHMTIIKPESFNLYDSLSTPVFQFLLLDRCSTGRSPVHSDIKLPKKMDFTIFTIAENDGHVLQYGYCKLQFGDYY